MDDLVVVLGSVLIGAVIFLFFLYRNTKKEVGWALEKNQRLEAIFAPDYDWRADVVKGDFLDYQEPLAALLAIKMNGWSSKDLDEALELINLQPWFEEVLTNAMTQAHPQKIGELVAFTGGQKLEQMLAILENLVASSSLPDSNLKAIKLRVNELLATSSQIAEFETVKSRIGNL